MQITDRLYNLGEMRETRKRSAMIYPPGDMLITSANKKHPF